MRRAGFLLLDGLLSVLLLGLVLGATFNFLPVSWLTVDRSGHRIQAQALADSWLERQRGRSFSRLTPGSETLNQKVLGWDYKLQGQVFVVSGHDPQRLLGLRCTVVWNERGRQAELENELWVSCVAR